MAKRKIALPSFFMFCVAIAFLACSLSTENWIESEPYNEELENSRGNINFGLFKGTEVMNFGLETDQVKPLHVVCDSVKGVCMYSDKLTAGERNTDLESNLIGKFEVNGTDISNPYLISYGLWASTVAFIGISIAFAAIGAVFCIVNSVMSPVEFITGIRGLYIWNGGGSIFSLCSIITWAVTYHNSVKYNILNKIYLDQGWSSLDASSLSFSFWLVLGAFCFFIFNVILILLLTLEPWVRKQTKSSEPTNPEGIIMLY